MAYRGIRNINEYVAVGIASFVGSITNTALVLIMAVIRGYLAPGVAWAVALTNGIPEAVVSVVITLAAVAAWMKIGHWGKRKSKISEDM